MDKITSKTTQLEQKCTLAGENLNAMEQLKKTDIESLKNYFQNLRDMASKTELQAIKRYERNSDMICSGILNYAKET